MKHLFKKLLFGLLIVSVLLVSCKKTYDNVDWVEKLVMYIGPDLVEGSEYISPGVYEKFMGMQKTNSDWEYACWETVPLDYIDGFTWEEGYYYVLEVERLHYTDFIAAGKYMSYNLIRIVSKDKVNPKQ